MRAATIARMRNWTGQIRSLPSESLPTSFTVRASTEVEGQGQRIFQRLLADKKTVDGVPHFVLATEHRRGEKWSTTLRDV